MPSISSRAVATVAGASILSLIVLSLLLVVPITALIVGIHYRDPRYCPIEPRISLFLIVSGSIALACGVVMILISVLTMFFASQRSSISIILGIILCIIIFLTGIFSTVWLIIGSVWTFSVRSGVTHRYDTINNYYTYNYCHPVLYQFTFIYLIVAYVGLGIQCCYSCYTNMCRSTSEI
jgi:hypothetical protein